MTLFLIILFTSFLRNKKINILEKIVSLEKSLNLTKEIFSEFGKINNDNKLIYNALNIFNIQILKEVKI